MRILIVAATESELSIFCSQVSCVKNQWFNINDHEVMVLVTGIGPVATTFSLTRELLSCHVDWVINAGIAGSYRQAYPIGSVVNVVEEQFSDLGVDDNGSFCSFYDLGLANLNEFPFKEGVLNNNDFICDDFPRVRGITSEQSHGSHEAIGKIKKRYSPDIETMEGGAIFFVCLSLKVPFVEIRSISNFVEPRDPQKWNIPLAIQNLAIALNKIINSL